MMTWRELMKFIADQDTETLDEEVKIYDYEDGKEHEAEITELLQDGWTPYLAINNLEE
jgi:hypothetical protein